MSDANEKDWNQAGRPSGSPGMTKGASVKSGLSEHNQITASHDQMGQGHGQGQRPIGFKSAKSASHHGKSFTYK